jgi:phage terminase Nu1 subunit (DNA packaging protein)
LQRLEASNSLATVQRWANEGMPIDAMGTPSKMDAYRNRKGTPVPWNVAQQNEQSLQRSKRAAEDTSPAGETQVPESVRNVVSSPGQPVDTALRKPVESEIGQSLDHARVHRSLYRHDRFICIDYNE